MQNILKDRRRRKSNRAFRRRYSIRSELQDHNGENTMPKVSTTTSKPGRRNDLASLVDRLGALKAQIATLCDEEKAIKEQLVDTRLPFVDGDLFRATIATSERTTLDSNTVKMFLTPSQILQCQRVCEVTTVRVTARIKTP